MGSYVAGHGLPSHEDLAARFAEARVRVAAAAHRTPVATSRSLDALHGARFSFKCESLQRMGAFKFRGAWNLVAQLPAAARARGLVAYSSGNHAQAVALVAREFGVPATIVMPSTAPRVKLEAVKGYGANVVHYDQLGEPREALAERLVRERGFALVPPFDHPDIVLGQGTAAAELFEDAGPLDLLLVPLGGGGLLSGCALAAKLLAPACRVVGVEPAAGDDGARKETMPKTVALIGTLDTKGPEIAYLRDRCQDLGLETLVIDSGILGEPLDIEPDFRREVVAQAGGSTLDALRQADSRGAAVHHMMKGVRQVVLDLYAAGRLQGVACLGGAEGAVLGAHAMQALPVGVPKLLATPIASGKRHFGPLMGLRDVMVIHSIVDILGLNPISQTLFDNMAAALAGMVAHGHVVDLKTERRYVAMTMLGNTTKAVMAAKERLAQAGIEAIIFHANGVGGPAMEELAQQGLFVGVIDLTTDELADELVGGFHNGGPNRLRVVGRLGLPQIVVPGCIDFTVHGPPHEIPDTLRGRPVYTHNPVFTLVRTLQSEMAELGRRFAERLNEAVGPLKIVYPTQGLSIPSFPPDQANPKGGVFWNPAADAAFLEALRADLRPDIPILEHTRHVNEPAFGVEVAELLLEMI